VKGVGDVCLRKGKEWATVVYKGSYWVGRKVWPRMAADLRRESLGVWTLESVCRACG